MTNYDYDAIIDRRRAQRADLRGLLQRVALRVIVLTDRKCGNCGLW